MTYAEAIAFLDTRINYEKLHGPEYLTQPYKLERVAEFYRLLGCPAAGTPAVHVTGTKGKGSTSAMLAGAMQRSGLKTALFTSPHIMNLGERFRVSGLPCPEDDLAALVCDLVPVLAFLDREEADGRTRWGHVTWFEITTMMAFLHFHRAKADAMVLEVGLGGRLDATNICSPMLSLVTSVSLDHTSQLGGTLEEIAFEKAGIIKPAVPVISGVSSPGPRNLIRRIADIFCADFFQSGDDFSCTPTGNGEENRFAFQGLRPNTPRQQFMVGMNGWHQCENASLVVQAARVLAEISGLLITPEALRVSLQDTRLTGRLQPMPGHHRVFLDAAHNQASIAGTLDWVNKTFPEAEKSFVFAISADKDWQAVLGDLAAGAKQVFLTEYHSSARAVPVKKLYDYARTLETTAVFRQFSDPREALAAALDEKSETGVLVVLGSFFLLSDLAKEIAF